MGGGISTIKVKRPIICPEDYDEKSFDKILKIYQTLNIHDNKILENDQIDNLANINIRSKKKKLIEKKLIAHNCYTKKKIELDIELKKSQKLLVEQHEKMFKNLNIVIKKDLNNLSNKIKELDSLSLNEKRSIFIKKITTRNELDFWKFFKYMKNKVNDMDNIVWTPKDNTIRKSSLLVKIKSPNTRPSEYAARFDSYYSD
jgi:hypothetical protein